MGRAFLGLLLLGALAVAGEDHDRAAREILAQLEKRDVGDWARELARTPIQEAGPDGLRRYMVYLRAGHLDRLPAVLDVLAGLDKKWRGHLIIYQLLERGAIDTARHAAERLPDPDHADRFLSRWKVDDATKRKWIAARYENNPKAWFWPWFEWEAAHGRGKPILDRLERELRANPGDYRRAPVGGPQRHFRVCHRLGLLVDDPAHQRVAGAETERHLEGLCHAPEGRVIRNDA